MDRLEAMSIVIVAVEKGSLTAAAKALNMPLPTLSRKVSELETHLGVKILQRSTRKLALTDVGRVYVESIKRIMREIEDVERNASGEYVDARGNLVVTAPFLFGQMYLVPIVTDFLAAYPAIDVRLVLSDRNLHMFDDQVDLAIRLGSLPDSSLHATRIGQTETLVVASPKLLSIQGPPKHPRELGARPCVVFDGPATTMWSFRDPATRREFQVDISPRLSVTAAESAVQAALRGTGFTRIYRYHCADALRAGKLTRVLADFDVDPTPIHILHAARAQLPQKTRVFLDYVTERLQPALASAE